MLASAVKTIDLIGSPYTERHDCNWLCGRMAERFEKAYPDVPTPADPAQWPAAIAETLAKHYRKVSAPTPGCIAIHRFFDQEGKEHWHCSTVLDDCKTMITTRERLGVHTVQLSDPFWRFSLMGFYEKT